MIFLFTLLLSLVNAKEIQQTVELSLYRNKFITLEEFFFEPDLHDLFEDQSAHLFYFDHVRIEGDSTVFVQFSGEANYPSETRTRKFKTIADYNSSVADRSLWLDAELIRQLRANYPEFYKIEVYGVNRFSQVFLTNFLTAPDMQIYFKPLIKSLINRRNPSFDIELAEDPKQSSFFQLLLVSLYHEGFVTNRSFAHEPRELTEDEKKLFPKLLKDQNRHVVKIGEGEQFFVLTENIEREYIAPKSTQLLMDPIVHYLEPLDLSKRWTCEGLLRHLY